MAALKRASGRLAVAKCEGTAAARPRTATRPRGRERASGLNRTRRVRARRMHGVNNPYGIKGRKAITAFAPGTPRCPAHTPPDARHQGGTPCIAHPHPPATQRARRAIALIIAAPGARCTRRSPFPTPSQCAASPAPSWCWASAWRSHTPSCGFRMSTERCAGRCGAPAPSRSPQDGSDRPPWRADHRGGHDRAERGGLQAEEHRLISGQQLQPLLPGQAVQQDRLRAGAFRGSLPRGRPASDPAAGALSTMDVRPRAGQGRQQGADGERRARRGTGALEAAQARRRAARAGAAAAAFVR